MKGAVTMFLVLMMAILLIVVAFQSFNITRESGEARNKEIIIQKDYHTTSSAMDAAELYVSTALRFSIYQALFEFGSKERVWYNNNKTNSTEELNEEIAQKIDSILNKYTNSGFKFLDDNYMVSLPTYKSNIKIIDGKINVSAVPNSTLKTEKTRAGETIVLERNLYLSNVFVDYRPLEAANKFLDGANGTDFVVAASTNFFNTTWKTSGEKKLVGCENKNKELENIAVFNEMHNTSFANFTESKNKIGLELSDKISNLSTFNISGIKLILQPNSIIAVASSCMVDRQDLCNQDNPSYTYTKICNFSYKYTINTTVTIEDIEAIYPIKPENENITFVPQKLVFSHLVDS